MRATAFVIYADGLDGVRRYLELVDAQVEWGPINAAHLFNSCRQAATMLAAVGLADQDGFGISEQRVAL